MKNKVLNAIAAILTAALVLSACGAGGKSLNSAEALKEYLDSRPVNGPDKPIKVAMKANDTMLANIVKAINQSGKYISLDFSGSPLTAIPRRAFDGCKSLAGIVIPNGITYIGVGAFADCTGLVSVTIPGSVTEIDEGAFHGCTSLTSVTFQGTIFPENFGHTSYSPVNPFPGDLHDKYPAEGPGTYTRASGGTTWIKK
jgi:hypothetical protein